MAQIDNLYVLSKMEENRIDKQQQIIRDLKLILPTATNEELLQLYNKSISIHQGKIQGNGSFLENKLLTDMLDSHQIPYRKQVTIDKTGKIVGFNDKKNNCHHIVDVVIGANVEINTYIMDYKVISCKTTCRERWTQDDWSYTFAPQLFILLTLSSDYPSSERFRESGTRKIITCMPKKKDDRIFKLNFEHLIDELR
jgi:hypothetical protein